MNAFAYLHDKLIEIRKERFQCPEALFRPSLLGLQLLGIHELVINSLESLDKDMQSVMVQNIVLTGGSILFPGFADRLQKELLPWKETNAIEGEIDIFEFPPEQTRMSSWVGGALVGRRAAFQHQCISETLYFDEGPQVISRMCF